ncbi:MAG: response regulator transcription factor [Dehalococcoidia bacterium]|nr:MAG: response regulator transcription factor [Dehalococcoidia bacterium]
MGRKTSILLVDDDPRLIRFARANLESVGYEVIVAGEAGAALQLLDRDMPDLAILDIMLPGMDGFELCHRIRQFSAVPIIMLTAKADETDKVKGLRLGADDYLTKPFGVEELLARVEAVLRRAKHPEETTVSPTFSYSDFSIDFLRHRVTVRGEEVSFTPTEYRLLFELAKNAGRVMFHEELLSRVWGTEYQNEVEYLRAYVRHLRQKIEDDPRQPQYILSKPGIGYMFASPP